METKTIHGNNVLSSVEFNAILSHLKLMDRTAMDSGFMDVPAHKVLPYITAAGKVLDEIKSRFLKEEDIRDIHRYLDIVDDAICGYFSGQKQISSHASEMIRCIHAVKAILPQEMD